jgi:hypothetical protein
VHDQTSPLSATASARNRDVNRPPIRLRSFSKLPELGGGLMAQDGVCASCQHCRHPSAMQTEPRVPNRVDPTMKSMEPPSGHEGPDTVVGKAERIELPQRHDAVLPRSKSREPVARLLDAFSGHTTTKASTSRN